MGPGGVPRRGAVSYQERYPCRVLESGLLIGPTKLPLPIFLTEAVTKDFDRKSVKKVRQIFLVRRLLADFVFGIRRVPDIFATGVPRP